MKLIYKPLTYKYKVSGTKIFKDGNRTTESGIEVFIKPRLASILTEFQTVRFTRNINADSNESAFDRFVKDSANVLNCFELEFTSKGEPYHVVNYQEIWKKWLSESDILNSRYTGNWVNKGLELMTIAIGDKNKLLTALLQDFCMNEIYNRNIFAIAFDNQTGTGKREWTETVLDGIPFLFKQEYQLKDTPKEDLLTIEGYAPFKENELQINRLCRGKSYTPEEITDITQKTVYQAFELSNLPEKIESVFKVNGKNGCLKETKVNVQTLKIKDYE
jgi:hypothetical protein